VFGWRAADCLIGSGGSEAAPKRISPKYAGSLRPSEFEERSRSAPVSPLSSPSCLLHPELVSVAELSRLVHPRRAGEIQRGDEDAEDDARHVGPTKL
jgi:hypothetical protein